MSASKRISSVAGAGSIAAIAAAIALPLLWGNQYNLQILMNIGVNIILALGLYIITGLAGQLSLCQGAFFGIGAYASALLTMRAGISFWLALPTAAVGTALLGMLVSIPALRLRGHYLAMLTLAFAVIVAQVLTNWVEVTRGPSGLISIPWPDPISVGFATVSIAGRRQYFVFIVLAVAAMICLAWGVQRSRLGMSLMTIREDEVAAEIMGVDTRLCKVIAFGLSGFFGAFAGGVYAPYAKILTPDEFGILQSVNILLMLIVGGAASVAGAVAGATIFTVLPEALRLFSDYRMIVFGTLLVLVIVYFPNGIAGTVRRLIKRRTKPRAGGFAAQGGDATCAAGSLASAAAHYTGALVVENVSKRFGGIAALSDVSLRVEEQEILGLIGPNGSGKSTLINVISGGYGPTSGLVTFNGKVISSKAAHTISRAGITRTFQKIRLFRDLTVLENVAAALSPQRVPALLPNLWTGRIIGGTSRMHDRAFQLLALVGLSTRQHELARNLSYGEQRMLEIARALATKPRLILLDEPAAGLSAVDVELLRGIIHRIQQSGIAILLVDHHTAFLMSVAHRVVVLNQGRVIFDGAPAEARKNRVVVEAYLGATAHAA